VDINDWIEKLESNFNYDNQSKHLLSMVISSELQFQHDLQEKYSLHLLLNKSFQKFFLETIDSINFWLMNNRPKHELFNVIFVLYIAMFRRFRACEKLLLHGYPLSGYALLRDLKDIAIFLGGIAHNLTTFNKVFGYIGRSAVSDQKARKRRQKIKKEEQRIKDWMLKKDSGLPTETIENLMAWELLFHEEVHGSKFTFYGELNRWMESSKVPSSGPVWDEAGLAMYLNRSSEVCWMILRLLPFIQPVRNVFSTEWRDRMKILDNSFRYVEEDLLKNGLQFADAFIQFIDSKFNFPGDFHYFDADGSAI
jgi:hypothetical protein